MWNMKVRNRRGEQRSSERICTSAAADYKDFMWHNRSCAHAANNDWRSSESAFLLLDLSPTKSLTLFDAGGSNLQHSAGVVLVAGTESS